MIRLKRLILVQFYLYDAVELDLAGNAAFLGPNGTGKTSLLDAIQIGMLGAHGSYIALNSQSAGGKSKRSIRDYCLGLIRKGEEENAPTDRRRDAAMTYVSLVFCDEATGKSFTAGASLEATAAERDHKTNGLYVLPGVALSLADHLESADGEQVPLRWSDFGQRVKRLCQAAHTTPSIQPHAEAYIRELLHLLQPQARHINPREFMKAFKNSMLLKNIESVDDYVRQHVIDEQRIDRRRAMAQIEEFRRLRQLVEQVEQQIAALDVLSNGFRNCAREYRRSATLNALAAIYEVEQCSQQISDVQDGIENRRKSLKKAERDFKDLSEAYTTKDEEYLAASANQDPSVRELEFLEKLKSERVENERDLRRDLAGLNDRLVRIVRRAVVCPELLASRTSLVQAQNVLASTHTELAEGAFTSLEANLCSVGGTVTLIGETLAAALEEARQARVQAEHDFKGARAAHEHVKRGGARISETVARLIEQLADEGIKATPICDLVSVKDPTWQCAIEGFLKRNRESLVIESGRERDAVRFVRRLPLAEQPYDITIVQPAHLRNDPWRDQTGVLVGSLLTGQNATALAYVRGLFGSTRCVETEEELERYPRALTADGMLSANGGTRRLRLPGQHQLLLGAQPSRDHEQEAATRMAETGDVLSKAIARFNALNELYQDRLSLPEPSESVRSLVHRLTLARDKLSEVEREISRLDRTQIDALRAKREAIAEERKALEKAKDDANGRKSSLQTEIDGFEERLVELRKLAEMRSVRERETRAVIDFDVELLDPQRQRFDEMSFTESAARIDLCRNEADQARDRADGHVRAVLPEFVRYIDTYGVAILEERSEWRKAQAWVAEESKRLTDSQLIQYRDQADHARAAAEEAFRKDIAIRLRESIQRMRTSLKSLDSLLASCPQFSNGERYRFEAKPAEHYKALYQYLMSAAENTGQESLFRVDDDVQAKVVELLEQQANPDAPRGSNPLEDYRLLFAFDLLIERDGEVISRLSNRIGSGSNGEHRVPYYIIAGVALAAAYRISPGKKPDGAALMLLDEAFYGIDHQNALATAEFLDSLGLQLVMAAPESDFGKLGSTCQTIYDIARDDLEIFIEPTQMKDEAAKLLQSDLPSKHPELLELALAKVAS